MLPHSLMSLALRVGLVNIFWICLETRLTAKHTLPLRKQKGAADADSLIDRVSEFDLANN